jgi:hypothetical protein
MVRIYLSYFCRDVKDVETYFFLCAFQFIVVFTSLLLSTVPVSILRARFAMNTSSPKEYR